MATSTYLPARVRISYGNLSYSTGDGKWVKLPSATNPDDTWNVLDLLFQYKLAFSQKIGKELGIAIEITGTPTIIFDGTEADKAKDFPLAKSYSTFNSIKLALAWAKSKPKPDGVDQSRQWLAHFTTPTVLTPAPALAAVHIPPALQLQPAPSSPSASRSKASTKATEAKTRLEAEKQAGKERIDRVREEGARRIHEVKQMLKRVEAEVEEEERRVREDVRRRVEAAEKELEDLGIS
ncbi:MAG: hypothetical protein Q9225_001284 [Loekoesia sp. 1 TL-2023]